MSHQHDPRSEKTREALIEAGLFCFSERWFDGTSLRMVAERAGKNTSLIAHHFGNKEGLYLAVFQDMLAQHAHVWFKGPVVEAEELRKAHERAVALLRSLIRRMAEKMHRDFEGLFDGGVASCEVKVNKPDPRIYQALLDKYHLRADECIFIDDRADNLVAASALGFGIYEMHNIGTLLRSLPTFGVSLH